MGLLDRDWFVDEHLRRIGICDASDVRPVSPSEHRRAAQRARLEALKRRKRDQQRFDPPVLVAATVFGVVVGGLAAVAMLRWLLPLLRSAVFG